jgi:hypothetical protein
MPVTDVILFPGYLICPICRLLSASPQLTRHAAQIAVVEGQPNRSDFFLRLYLTILIDAKALYAAPAWKYWYPTVLQFYSFLQKLDSDCSLTTVSEQVSNLKVERNNE